MSDCFVLYLLLICMKKKKSGAGKFTNNNMGVMTLKTIVKRSSFTLKSIEFLTEERLNLNQMRFVNLIVDYIVANGNIDDNKVLMGEPFKSVGSITSLFKDDMGTAKQIMEVVAQIKRNSEEIA